MTRQFATFQVNMLLTGRHLYAPVLQAPAAVGHLVFLEVWGYEQTPDHPGGRLPSIFLNADPSRVRFVLHVVDIDIADWHTGSYDAERDLDLRNNITSLDVLREVLVPYLDDFSALVSRRTIP
jgi:hypothetical protein